MELEMATTRDIVNELMNRQICFAFVAVEDTNSARPNAVCFGGKAADYQDVAFLFDMGREAFEQCEDDDGYTEIGFE